MTGSDFQPPSGTPRPFESRVPPPRVGGTPKIFIFWLFLDNLSISEQTIDRALTIHTEL